VAEPPVWRALAAAIPAVGGGREPPSGAPRWIRGHQPSSSSLCVCMVPEIRSKHSVGLFFSFCLLGRLNRTSPLSTYFHTDINWAYPLDG
jgi:hypothetical protein